MNYFTGFIENVTKPAKPYNRKSYYGMNVSGKQINEPIDQLDGFLVAKAIQESSDDDKECCFYPYVAGVYGILNMASPKRAKKEQTRLVRREIEKKELLQNVLDNLEIRGKIITTYELWNDKRYWELFEDTVKQIGNAGSSDGGYWGMPFEEFPKELLGSYGETLDENCFGECDSASLYVLMEVAEARYLNEKYDVSWKMGPKSEEMYDKFIRNYGLGIMQFRNPVAQDNEGMNNVVVPYIGKDNEAMRIRFSDTDETLQQKDNANNPSYVCAQQLLNVSEKIGLKKYTTIEDLINLGY